MRIRLLGYLFILGALTAGGWKMYTHFFDTTHPTLILHGIEQEKYYKADVPCTIESSKSGNISIWVDEQPLINQFYLSRGEHGYSFTIPSNTVSNGKHRLRIKMTDTSYHRNDAMVETIFYVDNIPLQAALLKTDDEYKVLQGRTLHVQFQVNKDVKHAKINALSNTYDCFPESKNSSVYEAFIPVMCEETPNEYLFSVNIVDNVGTTVCLDNRFQVMVFPFKKVHLTLASEKIDHENEQGNDNYDFEETIVKLSANSCAQKLWRGTFCTPIEIQRISTEFGTIRTTSHKGRYAHKALDILNLPKSVVWAPQDGLVVMKDRFAESGNTVVIDHGHGLLSLFFHLDAFANIAVNQSIAKGNPLGTLGKTGYASGYHLHWEMRLHNIPIDPIQWTKTIF